jgi:hypothetical protein
MRKEILGSLAVVGVVAAVAVFAVSEFENRKSSLGVSLYEVDA